MLCYVNDVAITHAEDVVCQVWIDVASSLPRFEGGNDDLLRWLVTIAPWCRRRPPRPPSNRMRRRPRAPTRTTDPRCPK